MATRKPNKIKKVEKKEKLEGVDQELESTEIGHMVNQHKALIGGAAFFIVLAVVLGSYFNHKKETDLADAADRVFEFEKEYLAKVNKKEIESAEFLSKLSELKSEVGDQKVLAPLILASAKELHNIGQTKEAADLLQNNQGLLAQDVYLQYFSKSFLAAYLEDLGEFPKAATALEELVQMDVVFLESKIYLDLGRLYLKLGEKSKATEKLQYVLDNFPKDDMAKLAKIYLSKI